VIRTGLAADIIDRTAAAATERSLVMPGLDCRHRGGAHGRHHLVISAGRADAEA
jgi:hypothetical protein